MFCEICSNILPKTKKTYICKRKQKHVKPKMLSMKKILLSVALAAVCMSSSAQKMNFIPWTENGYLTGTTISDNGKFLAGNDYNGQAFIYNIGTGEIKYYKSKELETGEDVSYSVVSDVWSVDDNGVAAGYVGEDPAKFSFEKGTYDLYKKDNASGAFRYMASDGAMFGLRWDKSYSRYPFMVDKEGNEKTLPMPSPSWYGWDSYNGGCVQGGNADGSVLVGYIMDDLAVQTLAFWIKNYNDDNYSVVPIGKEYYDGSMALDGDQPYDYMGGNVISSNGKWAAITCHKKDDYRSGNMIARYNVLTGKLQEITCPLAATGSNYVVSGISDEGTIVGRVEDASFDSKGIIVLGDETEAKLLADVYPTVKEWAELDNTGNNNPCHITPDGRYIMGYGYVDYSETSYSYGTYWFDTEGSNSVSSVKAADNGRSSASYTLDGRKVVRTAPNANRIFINKYDNGSVRKVLK